MKIDCLKMLLRRVAAFLYDCLLLIAVFFLITSIAIFFNNGNAIESNLFKLSLIFVAGGFFCGFWKHGGQTLGMRAWRIKLVNNEAQSISWTEAMTRFVTGLFLFVVTFVYALFDSKCQALHDKLSKTKIILEKDIK